MSKPFYVLSLAICASTLLAGCADGKVTPGSGVVLNQLHQTPVAQATVTFVCYGQRWGYLMHGSYEDHRVQVTTDAAGRFSFSHKDVSGCEYGSLYAEMTGQVHSSGAAIPRTIAGPVTKIPDHLYVMEAPDVVPVRLRMLAAPTNSDFRDADVGYETLFRSFAEAKTIASEEHRAQLVATYCRPLTEMWSRLSDDQRVRSQSHSVQWSWGGRSGSSRIDHSVVTAFCL
jgi:hypothetical protein